MRDDFSFETVGDGPVKALLIPGGPGLSAQTMRDDALLLSDCATSYLIDPPGTGSTPRPDDESGYLPDAVASFYRDALASLDVVPDVMLGASYGGLVAVNLVAETPHLARALALVSTVVAGVEVTDEWDFSESMLMRHRDAAWYASAREVFDNWTELIMAATSAAEVTAYYDKILPLYFDSPDSPDVRERINKIAAETVYDLDAMKIWEAGLYQRVDCRAAAMAVSCPTVVVCGESDWLAGPPVSRKTADLIGGSELEVIASCGHMPVVEQPERYRAAILAFLRRHEVLT